MKNSILNIIVALHCEGKAFIDFFRLKKITHLSLPFAIFINKEKTVYLIISGVGKVKTAAATTFIFTWSGGHPHTCLLNSGIAGSSAFAVGEVVVANKVTEGSTQRSWFPFVSALKHKRQCELITYDAPQNMYTDFEMMDMEGSAFFQTATLFVSLEQVYIIKIISDNNSESLLKINELVVPNLFLEKFSEIVGIINYLMQLSTQENSIIHSPKLLKKFLKRWHFTHAQALQLKELLRRWEISLTNEDLFALCQPENSAKNVLTALVARMDNYANRIF